VTASCVLGELNSYEEGNAMHSLPRNDMVMFPHKLPAFSRGIFAYGLTLSSDSAVALDLPFFEFISSDNHSRPAPWVRKGIAINYIT